MRYTLSGIYCIGGPSEICTQSAEVRLAVSGGQPPWTLGLPLFVLSLIDFLYLPWSPSTNIDILYFCQKYHLKETHKIIKKSCWFKIWMVFVGQILIKLRTSSIWGFLMLFLIVTYANVLVTTQWPLNHPPHLTSFVWVCVEWMSKSCAVI